MTTLKELAVMLDEAAGPSRDLDHAISFATNWEGSHDRWSSSIDAVESEQSETGSPYIAPGELDALTNSKCCETCAFTPGPCVDEAPVFCGHRFGWKRGQRSGPLRTEPEQGRDIRRLPRLQRRGHEVLETSV